jgi:hypothetical protein
MMVICARLIVFSGCCLAPCAVSLPGWLYSQGGNFFFLAMLFPLALCILIFFLLVIFIHPERKVFCCSVDSFLTEVDG